MMNKSKAKYAYTMLDLETEIDESVLQKLNAINGVQRVRVIK